MTGKIRHQLHLSEALSERFERLAAKPGANKSAMLEEALEHWLTRKGHHDLDDRFGLRLDRLTAALSRIERSNHIILESLALFIRYELAIHPPLAEIDHAGRAKGRERFQAFIEQVGQTVAAGKRTLDRNIEGGQ
jgi:predicted transcriptional regulator